MRGPILHAGLVALGRYQLTEGLGHGGFGEVWAALDHATQTSVAIKFLSAITGTPKQIAQFKDEFAILTRLAHPHINRVLDFGHEPDVGYALVAERVFGQSMMDATAHQPYPVIEALLVEALRALAYLHAHGIHHFDIKPANLLVAPDAHGVLHLKVIDFGLAALRPIMEKTGTPSFMAPELVLAEPADGRADLYALGIAFSMCVTRANPFRGPHQKETWERQLRLIPPPLTEQAPTAPQYINAFVKRLLEKRPTDRYASAAHALRELQLLSPAAYPVEAEATRVAYAPAGALVVGQAAAKAAVASVLQQPAGVCCLTGGAAMGKSTVLRWARYEAALAECRVLALAGPADGELAWWVEQVTACLVGGNSPVVLLIDDLDACLAPSADPSLRPVLRALFELVLAGALPHVRVVASAVHCPPELSSVALVSALQPFTELELADYLSAVVPLDPVPRADLAQRLMHQTGGHPGLVAHAVRTLLAQGYLVDASGAWGESQFADITIDVATLPVPERLQDERRATLESLPPQWRDAVAWLAAWGEPIDLTALHAIAGDSPAAWHATLHGLVGLQLVHADPTTGTYHLADVGVQTAIHALIPAAARREQQRIIAEYLRTTGAAESLVDRYTAQSDAPDSHAALVRWALAEQHQGRAARAIAALQTRLTDPALPSAPRVPLTFTLARLCLHADRCPEGRSAVEALLSFFPSHQPPATSQSPLPVGVWFWVGGRTKENDATPQPRATSHELEAHEWLGRLHLREGHIAEAEHAFTTALTACRAQPPLPDPVWDLRLRNDLALCALYRQDVSAARTCFEQTLQAAAALPHPARARVTNNELGQCLFQQREFAAAQAHFEAELAQWNAAPHADWRRAHRLYYLGEIHRACERFAPARACLETALGIAKELQDVRLLATTYNGLGNLWMDAADYAAARVAYERGLPYCYRLDDVPRLVGMSVNVARVHLLEGAVAAAASLLRSLQIQVERASATEGIQAQRFAVYHLLGECQRRQGDWAGAARTLEQVWDWVTAAPASAPYRFSIATTRAEVALDQRDHPTARHWLDRARPYRQNPQEQQLFAALEAHLSPAAPAVPTSTR
ncbi:MAG: protein kinase [Deltaproteobacteria bacterium]|nr:protein kinase [Deltaproteobacteria bacterium]